MILNSIPLIVLPVAAYLIYRFGCWADERNHRSG